MEGLAVLLIIFAFGYLLFSFLKGSVRNSKKEAQVNKSYDYKKSHPKSNYSYTKSGFVRNEEKKEYNYTLVESLFTNAEQRYFEHLTDVISDRALIFAKVRLLDIFSPTDKKAFGAVKKISSKHVDFLICSKDNQNPLFAIELDDSSHRGKQAQERDIFVNKLFQESGLKLFRVECKSRYLDSDTKDLLKDILSTF